MLLLLPLVLALATEPAPAASSPAHPTPLTEIGRVRALPACTPIVAHANGAIAHALDNDRALTIITTNLHATDFDKLNSLQRRNAIDALLKQATAMRENASAGDVEIKKLKEYAANASDATRKAELKAFADALGGALYRQKKAAVEFMRDVTVLRGREEAAEAREIMKRDNPTPPYTVAQSMARTPSILPPPPVTYNETLRAIGADIAQLGQSVLMDEGIAADHSIAATSGC